MKAKVLMVAVLALALLVDPAIGSQERGDEFFWRLTGQEADEMKAAIGQINAIGYLDGFIDSCVVTSMAVPEAQVICFPESGISVDQASRIVIKYLEANPEALHNSARILVFEALMNSFPCKKK